MSMTVGTGPRGITLPFEKFWVWLQAHPNCIVRVGTPEVVLFDHDDFHWNLAIEDENTFVVQLAKAKELVGELVVFVSEIAYVHCDFNDNDEFVCECIVETPTARESAYHFVMAHAYDEAEVPGPRRWTH
jgi:hypothetical protein